MNVQMPSPVTSPQALADFIHGTRFGDLPPDVVHMARRCLVDTLAIWAAGSQTEASRIARGHAARRYSGGDDCIAMPFDGRAVNAVGYAFAGGVTIDAVDGHDGHQLTKGHASVALVPALLAELGAAPDCSMDDLLTHFVVGHEVAIRAGLSLHATVPDYHSSGAWNALGCAAIAARRRRFSEEQTRQALGIAEYYGPRAQMMRCIDHPTMVKDSSSWGAMAGISAADLAEDGFTGAPALTCESAEAAAFWADLGQVWRILETNFKAYPVCRWAQPAVEGALALVRAHDVAVEEIAGITVTTFHEATRLATRRPGDGDAAQYSLPLSVALALIHGTILPVHLLPEQFDRADVWRLVGSIRLAEKDDYNAAFPAERFADVMLTLADGRKLQSRPMQARGNFDNPLSDEEILQKLEDYSAGTLSDAGCAAIARILCDPDNAPDAAALSDQLQAG